VNIEEKASEGYLLIKASESLRKKGLISATCLFSGIMKLGMHSGVQAAGLKEKIYWFIQKIAEGRRKND
jgi:hypothetical protein